MSEISTAWLMHIGAGKQIAVAEKEIVEYLPSPDIYQIPLAPPYCSSVVFWRDRILPLFNLVLLTQPKFAPKTEYMAILAYQTEPKTPLSHIAVVLYAPPEKIMVSDDDVCDWPEVFPEIWKSLTRSLFNYNGEVTPVLDIEALCAGSSGK